MMQVVGSQSNQVRSGVYLHSAGSSGGEYEQQNPRNSYPLENQESISPGSSRSGSPEALGANDVSMNVGGATGGIIGGPQQPIPSATSADACMTIVHCLMCYRQQGGESEAFSKRAIESLVKKMKDKRDELDSLITAVTSGGSRPTRCVTIQRTLDGRLQVAGRKGFPHVVYARIWRWPDLHKNELKNLRLCQYAFDLKLDLVCVNPYHYERVIAPAIDLTGLSLSPDDVPPGSAPPQGFFTESGGQQFVSPGAFAANSLTGPGPAFTGGVTFAPSSFVNAPHNALAVMHPLSSYGSAQPQPQPQRTAAPPIFSPAAGLGHYGGAFTTGQPQPQPGMDVVSTAGPSATALSAPNSSNTTNSSGLLTNQPMPEYWCTIAYFELDQQVGEIYKVHASCTTCTVDGYTDPNSTSRFCLGQLSSVHRTEASDHARVHIGKGIQLELVGECDIWLRCLSDHSVFVQSYYLDREAGRQPFGAVHKIYPTAAIKVFDLRLCYSQMKAQVNAALVAAQGSLPVTSPVASAPSVAALAGLGVDDLRKLCAFRVSFVKGFGPDYARRTIKETPCWIEVQLNRPLQLLDEVLQQSMPLNDLSSRQFYSTATAGPNAAPPPPPPAVSTSSPTGPF